MSEDEVLSILRNRLFISKEFEGFVPVEKEDFLQIILDNSKYLKKEKAEDSVKYKQPIPYVWMIGSESKKVLLYRRGDKNENEPGLVNVWTGGVAGHIERIDGLNGNPVKETMVREISEEVVCESFSEPQIIGFANDNSSRLWERHFGVVAVSFCKKFSKVEDSDISYGKLYSVDEAGEIIRREDVEPWTKYSWPFVKRYLEL